MCYIGKATKIFIFLVTVLIITGILLGFGVLRRAIHPHSHHQCSGYDDCSQSDSFFPPPEFPIPSSPDFTPPQSQPSNTNLAPPPPASRNVAPPIPPATSLPSPPPPPVTSFASPPPVVAKPPSPPVIVVAPPPEVNPPPSEVPVTPGPVTPVKSS